MAVKNFVFRGRWVSSKVAGIKITGFVIFEPTWTHISALKGPNKRLLEQFFVNKDKNYIIINFVTLRLIN